MAKVNPAITADLNARFFALQQKMFMENNMDFFKDYEAMIKKFEGSKIMKFISKLSTGKQVINLVEFYKAGNKNQPLYIWPNFQKILDEATSDSVTVEIDETFFQYLNNEAVQDNAVMAELKEVVVDMGTAEGRLEARKRLATLAFFLSKQPKAEAGELLTNGYANVIGWFKTKSGSVFSLCASWDSGSQEWGCVDDELGEWLPERQFWSRNGETQ